MQNAARGGSKKMGKQRWIGRRSSRELSAAWSFMALITPYVYLLAQQRAASMAAGRKPAAAGLLHNITLNIMYKVKFSVSTRSFAARPDIGALHRIQKPSL